MKKFNKINNLAILISTVSSLASVSATWAQTWRYDGPAVDYNFIKNPPADYQECQEKYQNNPLNAGTVEGALRVYRSCDFGLDEARRMAERFGGGNGKIQGYLRGYSWGMFKGVRTGKNDAEAVAEGRRMVEGMGDLLQRGLQDGKKRGRDMGLQEGAIAARGLFENAVGSGRFPDSGVKVPVKNYDGEDNGYAKVVGTAKSEREIIGEAFNSGDLPIYASWDETYLGERKPLRTLDLWFNDGVYNFPKAYWFDSAESFQAWRSRPLDSKPKYENLNNPAIFALKMGPDGKPLYETVPEVDSQGNPVFKRVVDPVTGAVTFQPVMTTRAVQGGQINIQAVFESAFKKSYEWYVNYYFSREFFDSRDMGVIAGEGIGLQVGKRLAQQAGTIEAFDALYKKSTKETFQGSYKTAYEEAFKQTYDFYAKNPILSAKIVEVIGADNVGIIQPGELISIRFQVRNAGGVPTALNVSAQGKIVDGKTQQFEIRSLEEQTYTAQLIARIDPRAQNRERISLALNINGQIVPTDQVVQRMVQILAMSPSVDATKGQGDITVTLKNVATVRTPGTIDLKLTSGASNLAEMNLGYLAPGSVNSFTLSFNGIDPLTLIKGGIEVKAVASLMGNRLDDGSIQAKSAKPNLDLVRYFNQVANKRGLVPVETNAEERLSDLNSMLISANQTEAQMISDGSNLYKENPTATIVGALVNELKTTPQSDDAKYRFDYLGRELYKTRKIFGQFLWFKSGKRSAYEDLCEQLSRSGEY